MLWGIYPGLTDSDRKCIEEILTLQSTQFSANLKSVFPQLKQLSRKKLVKANNTMPIWSIILAVLVIFTLLASIRLGLEGIVKFPTGKLFNFSTSRAWCLSLFIFLPWKIGEFARAGNSPLPWEAFAQANLRHGLFEGILTATIVLLVNIWLFWVPANIWVNKYPNTDTTKRIMARIINLLLGLLLTQVANPIYSLLV
jgi:hypothetical protein